MNRESHLIKNKKESFVYLFANETSFIRDEEATKTALKGSRGDLLMILIQGLAECDLFVIHRFF